MNPERYTRRWAATGRWSERPPRPAAPSASSPQEVRIYRLVAEVLVVLATDTTVYFSRWAANKLAFTIRASDSSWHPGLPGRPLVTFGLVPSARGPHLLHRNVQRFRGGLVCKAHRLLYHSTLGLRVIKKKRRSASTTRG